MIHFGSAIFLRVFGKTPLQPPQPPQPPRNPERNEQTMNRHFFSTVSAGRLVALTTAATITLTAMIPCSVEAQSEPSGRVGLLDRLRNKGRDQQQTAAAAAQAQRSEIDTTRTEIRPVAAVTAATPTVDPIPTPAPATETVARERAPGEVPRAAPVATPVAAAPPMALAEPVARSVPGAQPLQSETAPANGGASPAAAPKGSPIALLANAEVPEPRDLEPQFDKENPPKEEGPVMEITSDESVMHNQAKERMVEFTGDVFLDHPSLNMTSDRLEVYLNDEEADAAPAKEGEKKPPFKRAIATGAMVKIERINPSGEVEVAFARRADFDGISGDVVLSGGPPELQTGKIHVNPSGANSKIFLLANGKYSVEGGVGDKSRVVIPIPASNADGQTQTPNFLPTKLNDMKSDRGN